MCAVDTITRIREALQSRRGDWPTICGRTGLSYWWLTKFAQGRIAEPGLSKIERLQADLAANPATDRRRGLRQETAHG
jgi:hypothetical protein